LHSSTRSPHHASHPPGAPHDLIPHDRDAIDDNDQITITESRRTDHRPARCRAMPCNNPYWTDPRCGTRSRSFFYRVDAGPDLGDSEIEDFRYTSFSFFESLRDGVPIPPRVHFTAPMELMPFSCALADAHFVCARACVPCVWPLYHFALCGAGLSGIPEVGVETPTSRRRRCWVSISRLPMQLPSNVSALTLRPPRYFDAAPRVRTGSTVTPRSARRTGYTSVKSKANHMMRCVNLPSPSPALTFSLPLPGSCRNGAHMHAGAFRKAAIKNHPDKHPEDEREVRVHTNDHDRSQHHSTSSCTQF